MYSQHKGLLIQDIRGFISFRLQNRLNNHLIGWWKEPFKHTEIGENGRVFVDNV